MNVKQPCEKCACDFKKPSLDERIISETKPLVMLMDSLLSSGWTGKFEAVKHFNHMCKPQPHLAVCMIVACVNL